ncbi:hypothetical protein [Aliikangiella sp. G2MR2-5]|uniref:hypothetical protein n=1 Tax=Aliikangiella sp. G2MR2-5 TaxID=2788943 RepID=UPI0018A88A8E|nr:hypothetical protein [Aliikangiella sp. G2MR2-5]
MKKVLLVLVAVIASSNVFAETWINDTKVKRIYTYGVETSSAKWACFTVENGPGRPLCFDHTLPGGNIQFSLLMTAKTSGASVQVSYNENESASFWVSNYKAKHIYLIE